jgi:hypothetical protein
MFKLVFALWVLLSSCACQPVKDQAKSPAELNHNRIPIQIDGQSEVGINGTISGQSIIKARAYYKGSVSIRGLEDCGYYLEEGIAGLGWVSFNASELPQNEFCLYHVQARINRLDSPAIGKVLIRRFLDPNVKPLQITMNNVKRLGVNWVQLKESVSLMVSKAHNEMGEESGISEDRKIIVYPSGKTGKMIITGCGIREIYYYDNTPEWQTTVDNLYKSIGQLNKDCVFTITANNDDTLKESATFLVSVYKEEGGYLAAPLVSIDRSACFEFTDNNVIAIRINTVRSKKINQTRMCITRNDAEEYEVEAITSKQRVFWGTYKGDKWISTK